MLSPLTRLISHTTGLLARMPLPQPFRVPLYRAYSRLFGVNLTEVELPLADYGSLSEFFIRRLQSNSRAPGGAVCCPADAFLFDTGMTEGRNTFNAKGIDYKLEHILFLQDPALIAKNYRYFLLHLRPGDYHRVHCPVDGEIVEIAHAAGSLLPVNDLGRRFFPDLFCVNERVLVKLNTEFGVCFLVLFGALNVGSIFIEGTDLVTNSAPFKIDQVRVVERCRRRVEKGSELGGFKMGSSVMLLVPENPDLKPANILAPAEVRVGQAFYR